MAEAKLRNLLKILPLRDKYDAIILAIHACLVDKEFRCVGSGEQRNASEEFDFGETLPPDWNASPDVFALQYKKCGSGLLYLFKALKLGTMLAVYVMEEDESKMYDITINVDEYTVDDTDYTSVRGHQDATNRAFRHLDQLKAKLNRDVINKFTTGSSQAHGLQQQARDQTSQENHSRLLENDPLRIPPRRPPNFRDEWSPPAAGPFPYGDGDRFPGHPGGGGMLMDPFRSGGLPTVPGAPGGPPPPGQLPRGAVPPGARFDPFGPILPGAEGGARPNRPGRFAGPDPDHLPPPGYDDMFM